MSNDAENSALTTGLNCILQYQNREVILNCDVILWNITVFTVFAKINAALVNVGDFFQKQKSYCVQTSEWLSLYVCESLKLH